MLNNDAVFDEPKCAWSVWHVLNVKAGLQKYDQIIVCFWYHQKQFVIKGKKPEILQELWVLHAGPFSAARTLAVAKSLDCVGCVVMAVWSMLSTASTPSHADTGWVKDIHSRRVYVIKTKQLSAICCDVTRL